MTTLEIKKYIEGSGLFRQAFIHKSYYSSRGAGKNNQNQENFERLEFLGDALLGVLITEMLYKAYPHHPEGDLSRWKSALVGQKTFAQISTSLNLVKFLECKESERETLVQNDRIKASLLESFMGAYYLEYGFLNFKKISEALFTDFVEKAQIIFEEKDPKTLLQEASQKNFKFTPVYKLIDKKGEDHAPEFLVEVTFGRDFFEKGKGHSLKVAQEEAAKKALERIEGIKHEG